MSCIKRLLACLIIFFVLCLVLPAILLLSGQVQPVIGNFLVVKDNLYPVDVVHVIAGEDYRTEYAIQLYQQGFARSLFFTGGWCEEHGYYHGEHAMQLALSEGVAPEDIGYDDSPVLSTYDETVLLKNYLQSTLPSTQSVIVVSDPFHMRRAHWTARMVFGEDLDINMQPVPFEQTTLSPQWWTDAQSREYVWDEYMKLVFYLFRYQLGWSWLGFLDKY